MEEIIYLYVIVIILIIANIGVSRYQLKEMFQLHSPIASPISSQFYTNSKIPWNTIYQNVSHIETLVADISNSIPLQFKLGSISQKVMTNPIINNNNQNVVPSSANCSLVNSFYSLWSIENDTTADVVKEASQIPIVTVDGSVPSNIRLNFIFPTPVPGAMGPIGPTGPVGPDGLTGPPGPMGVQGYWA